MTMYRWFIAASCAVLLHLGAFYALFSHTPDDGAQGWGSNGIEFDLGMLGDIGASDHVGNAGAQADSSNRHLAKPNVSSHRPSVVSQSDASTPAQTPIALPTDGKTAVKAIKQNEQSQRNHTNQNAVSLSDPEISPEPKTMAHTSVPNVQSEKKKRITEKDIAPHDVGGNLQAATATKDSLGRSSAADGKRTSGSGNANHAGGNPNAQVSYFAQLNAKLAQHKFYPSSSRKRKEEGVATVSFRAHPNGRATAIRVTQGSGYRNLDKAVIEMVKRAQPLPRFSEGMDATPIEVVIPIEFRLN